MFVHHPPLGAVQEAARHMNTSRTNSAQVDNSNDTFRRRVTVGLVLLVSAAAFAGRLAAQTNSPFTHGTVRPIFGAYVPTGDQRDFLKDAVFAGAQGSLNVISNVAVTGSFGWAPSKDKLTPG